MSDLYTVWIHGVGGELQTMVAGPGEFSVRMFPEVIESMESVLGFEIDRIYTDTEDNLCWRRTMSKETDPGPKPVVQCMTIEDTQAVAKLHKVLSEIDQESGHYLEAKVRVWNTAGWSPGYFEFEDDWVNFYPDYQESP